MNLWHLLSGTLQVRLTSASLEEILSDALQKGMELRSLSWENDLVCVFRISRSDWRQFKKSLLRFGGKAEILQHQGLYWSAVAAARRPVLLLGMLTVLIATLWLPQRILFFRVNGNVQVSEREILQAAEESGLYFGVSRKALRSEKVKNSLLSLLPELSWAGVNTAGCVAEISVRERAPQTIQEEYQGASDIVASRDGYLLSGTVLRGSAQFQPGQTVTAGQILISGDTDCGICVQTTRAEGEIWAQTQWDLRAKIPQKHLIRGEILNTKRKISLLFRKKRINLWKDSGISPTTCDRMYTEYYVTLPGGFILPLALCVDTYTQYGLSPGYLEQERAEQILSEFASRYLPEQMAAGRILQAAQQLEGEEACWVLQGHYVCEEMISRQQLRTDWSHKWEKMWNES